MVRKLLQVHCQYSNTFKNLLVNDSTEQIIISTILWVVRQQIIFSQCSRVEKYFKSQTHTHPPPPPLNTQSPKCFLHVLFWMKIITSPQPVVKYFKILLMSESSKQKNYYKSNSVQSSEWIILSPEMLTMYLQFNSIVLTLWLWFTMEVLTQQQLMVQWAPEVFQVTISVLPLKRRVKVGEVKGGGWDVQNTIVL